MAALSLSLELRIGADITLLEAGRTYVLRLPEGATAEQARTVADDLHTALERLPPEQRPVVWLAQGGLQVEDVTEGDASTHKERESRGAFKQPS